jgi:hypothetical protein
MRKIFIKVIIILILGSIVLACDVKAIPYLRPLNNFSLNLFGDASVFSISYERLFISNRKFILTGKFGAGYSQSLGLPSKSAALLSTPMHITGNVNIYGKKHFLEFGFGGTLLFYENMKFWDYSIFPVIGYRLQPLKSGNFTLRLFVSYPLTDKLDIHNYWFSPVGMSIGFCF